MAETVALLTTRTRLPRTELIQFIASLKSAPHLEIVHIDEQMDAEAWALLKARPDKNWSLVDASSFVVMETRSIREALTTDHQFTQTGFILLPQ
jgi:predicted nucleic acid-binding protein